MNIFPLFLALLLGVWSSHQDAKTLKWEVWKSSVFTFAAFTYWAIKGYFLLSAFSFFIALFFGLIGYLTNTWDHEDVAIIGTYGAITPTLQGQLAIFPLLGNLILLLLPLQVMKQVKRYPVCPFIFEAWIIGYFGGNFLFKLIGW